MYNKAILVGRVGKKEFKTAKSGTPVLTLSVATSKNYKDAEGVRKELTTWHFINAFSKLAENMNKFLHVGDLAFFEGEIQNKQLDDGRWLSSVTANEFRLLPSGKSAAGKPTIQSQLFVDDELLAEF